MESRDLFEILIREHAAMLNVYLETLLRDRAAVDDVFQETLLVAWRRLDDFDKERPFGPWLRGIAGRLVLAHHRKTKRRPILCEEQVLEHLDARCEALHQQPGDTLGEKLDALRECLDRLPERFRTALALRYAENLRGSRLAERLEISVENAKKRLQRGRQQLLECMEPKLDGTGAR